MNIELFNVEQYDFKKNQNEFVKIKNRLINDKFGLIKMSDWIRYPEIVENEEINKIKDLASKISKKCTLLVVIGIGGSFLGTKAIIDIFKSTNSLNGPEVIFAGTNICTSELIKIIDKMNNESVYLCCISKSGNTLETSIYYSVLKDTLIKKYGKKEAFKRICIITNNKNGRLRKEAIKHKTSFLTIPDQIGGRYSVLTPVGLLPLAIAGCDIDNLILGAKSMYEEFRSDDSVLDYSMCRIAFQNSGKVVELFETFEYGFEYFGEWLKQLFGETEGKNGKGAFPAYLFFSRDLHSLEQFIQQGNQIFSETIISVKDHAYDFDIPKNSIDKLHTNLTFNQVNNYIEESVIKAHCDNGIPIVKIEIPIIDEFNIGKLIYFFEMSAAISAYMLNVNPFDQPGVEAYKKEIKKKIKMKKF